MKKLFLIVVLLVGVFVTSLFLNTRTALAAGGDITVHTLSTHFGVDGLNNINPGVAYDLTDRLRLGALLNSYEKPSAYVAYLIPLCPTARVGVGLISGYGIERGAIEGRTSGILPLLAVEVDVLKNISVVWMGQAINLEVKFR